MIKKIDANKYGVVRYAISSIEDIADLPREVSVGSEAILVNEDGEKKFRLGSDGWVEVVEVKEYDEDVLRDILEDAKVGYGGIEYETLEERLDKDFDDVYSVLDNRAYIEYEDCRITAKDSLNGLQKETVIKGRTLQNLCDSDLFFNKNKWCNLTDGYCEFSNGYLTLTARGDYVNGFSSNNGMFKLNTTYTLLLDIKENSLDAGFVIISDEIHYPSIINDAIRLDVGVTGILKIVFVVNNTEGVSMLRSFISPRATSGSITFRYAIFEGDHTETPIEELPFIEGIESVGDKSKNLFDSVLLNNKINNSTGIIIDRHSKEHYSSNFIQCDSLKTYTVSINYNDTVSELMLFEYDNEKNFIKKNSKLGTNSLTVTLSNDTKYVRLSSFKGYGFNEYNFDFQLEEGTQATSYEPYYDGYKISSKSCGKNLLNINSNENIVDSVEAIIDGNTLTVTQIEEGSWRYYGVKLNNLKPNTTYTCSATIIGDSPCRVRIFDIKTYKEIAHFNSYNGKVSFTPTINLDSIWALFYTSYNKIMPVGTVAIFKDIMLEEDTTPTQYEPYKESTYSYILDEPLRSLPNGVCDEIDLEKGIVTRRVGKVVLDGSEIWYTGESSDGKTRYTSYIENSANNTTREILISDKFCYIDMSIPSMDNGAFIHVNHVYIYKHDASDSTAFKQWLQANPTTVYYELANPTTEYLIKDDKFVTLPNGVKDEAGRIVTRNVGKIVFDGSEEWRHGGIGTGGDDSTLYAIHNFPSKTITNNNSIECICDTLPVYSANDSWKYTGQETICSLNVLKTFHIRIHKSKLSEDTPTGFKEWLSQHPITVYYQVETPYIECSYEEHPTLPNGVKDEISHNSVLRKVGKIVVDGSQVLTRSGTNNNKTKTTHFSVSGVSANSPYGICDKLPTVIGVTLQGYEEPCMELSSPNRTDPPYALWLNIDRSNADTVEEAYEYFRNNPHTVWYELITPYTEPINLDEVILDTTRLKSYEPITHITSDNYLPPTIKTQVPSDFNAVVLGLKSNNEALANQVMSLRQTNDELEATNREQDDVIDVTLLALDEVYGMIDEGEIETMSTGSPMVNVYVKMIKRGIKTLDEVPAKYRAEVEELI